MKWLTVCFVVLVAISINAGQTAAQTIEGLHGDAASAIEVEILRNDFGDPVTAHVFYGDLTGTGTNDAIAFLYHPSGGNSYALTTWIWRGTESGYVFGFDPRDVRFSAGRIEVTTTVPKPGDPRCCPSGEQTFTLSLDGATQAAEAKNDLDVPVMEHGGDGQAANCASSTVHGLKAGGDGFLSVRSGPGTQYRKIDELYNGDVVIVYEVRDKWAGVVYRTETIDCGSTVTRPVPYENKGWVHTNWLRDLAG